MNPAIAVATGRRVLLQLRGDRRTIALLLVVPAVLLVLMRYVFDDDPLVFQRVGAPMLGIFPLVSMFLVTSIAMLRERTSGTLERLMSMPLAKLDILAGYGIAFSVMAVLQAAVACAVAFGLLDLRIAGPTWMVVVLAVLNAVLGMALGLFLSAFASTEFQAVQFMPAFLLPQLLLCGLLADRGRMAAPLRWLSDLLPMTYAYDALHRVATASAVSGRVLVDMAVVVAVTVLALALGAATLRRRTD
jgi:ABC-2 type transport system permease protein